MRTLTLVASIALSLASTAAHAHKHRTKLEQKYVDAGMWSVRDGGSALFQSRNYTIQTHDKPNALGIVRTVTDHKKGTLTIQYADGRKSIITPDGKLKKMPAPKRR
jgi:hypothetical protein